MRVYKNAANIDGYFVVVSENYSKILYLDIFYNYVIIVVE